MTDDTDLELWSGQTDRSTKDIGPRINEQMARCNYLTEDALKDNSKMIFSMEKGKFYTQMVMFLKDNLSMEKLL